MRFTLLNTVPPGLCRKLHALVPGGNLDELTRIERGQLRDAWLSPTHMEAIQGLVDWKNSGISPPVGLVLWYFETIQDPMGAFCRTSDAALPSVGVAIRFLQIAGTLDLTTHDAPSVRQAAVWLETELGDDGVLDMPTSGLIDFGMQARAIRSLHIVQHEAPSGRLEFARNALSDGRYGSSTWPTYPGGKPSVGATSLAISAIAPQPDRFSYRPSSDWLWAAWNADGGWGEYPDSPSRVDNTFWTSRALLDLGETVPGATIHWVQGFEPASDYERAMKVRLAGLLEVGIDSRPVENLALGSLTKQADRYAETALYGLALAELARSESVEVASFSSLPIKAPDFIRREPPIYDQLASIGSGSRRWLRAVNHLAQVRMVESAIGWLVGASAALAVLGGELIDGLSSLPLLAILPLVVIECLIASAWMGLRLADARKRDRLSHFVISLTTAIALVTLIANPAGTELDFAPGLALTLMLTLIIDVVMAATDKADLLNRLNGD